MAPLSRDDLAEEQRVFLKVLAAFDHYLPHAVHYHRTRMEHFRALPLPHQLLLRDTFIDKLRRTERAFHANAAFLTQVAQSARHMMFLDEDHFTYALDRQQQHPDAPPMVQPSELDMDKVRSTLKQLVRDWSDEGQAERAQSYQPILDGLLSKYASVDMAERQHLRVLVPGAGLGRLMLEVASLGFGTEGNEFSFHMLFTSDFLLNRLDRARSITIHPYVHTHSNHVSDAAMLRGVEIPDVLARDVLQHTHFSMVAGDFVEVYDKPEQHLATCFFIDTAHNIVQYIEIISRLLKPGGHWINLGPLLYHFEGSPGEASLELSLDEVKRVSAAFGLEVQAERMVECTYVHDPQSMLRQTYTCAYFEATRTAA